MAFQMIQETSAYIEKWGIKIPTDESTDNPIDKEWKILSGGECQRMILAIALASRPRVLLVCALHSYTKILISACVNNDHTFTILARRGNFRT